MREVSYFPQFLNLIFPVEELHNSLYCINITFRKSIELSSSELTVSVAKVQHFLELPVVFFKNFHSHPHFSIFCPKGTCMDGGVDVWLLDGCW